MPSRPTVYVVDDQRVDLLVERLTAEGLTAVSFRSAEHFLRNYDPTQPGCLVVDVCMDGMSGLELLKLLRARGSTLPVIVLTGYPQVPGAVQAIKNGAIDYVDKHAGDDAIVEVIKQALARDAANRAEASQRDLVRARIASLSARQRQVLDQIVTGKSNKEIAQLLKRHKKTVESHRNFIMRKMQASNVADLVRMYYLAMDAAPPELQPTPA